MQQAFPAATSWTMSHPWGSTHPYVVATNDDGTRTYIVGPEYSDGQVTVTFGRPTSGVLELLNPTGSGSSTTVVDGLVSGAEAVVVELADVRAVRSGSVATGRTAIVGGAPSAVVNAAQGAVIE